jgi:hypothetical protein
LHKGGNVKIGSALIFLIAKTCLFRYNQRLSMQARSSVVEHHLDMVVVGGSIPLVPTIRFDENQHVNNHFARRKPTPV